jgi:hypothetical protein
MSNKSYTLTYPNVLGVNTDYPTISIKELENLPDNSVENLYCSNILEIYPDISKLLLIIESKLRLSGNVYIICHNIDIIAENYLDNSINIEHINKVLCNKTTIYNIATLVNTIQKNNLQYKTIKTDTLYIYIIAGRLTNNE